MPAIIGRIIHIPDTIARFLLLGLGSDTSVHTPRYSLKNVKVEVRPALRTRGQS